MDWLGIPLGKANYSFPTSFARGRSQRICRICDLQVLKDIRRHFTTDGSCFWPYAEPKIMELNEKSAWKGFNLGLDSDQVPPKSQVSLSRDFLAVLIFLLMPQLMSCESFLVALSFRTNMMTFLIFINESNHFRICYFLFL